MPVLEQIINQAPQISTRPTLHSVPPEVFIEYYQPVLSDLYREKDRLQREIVSFSRNNAPRDVIAELITQAQQNYCQILAHTAALEKARFMLAEY